MHVQELARMATPEDTTPHFCLLQLGHCHHASSSVSVSWLSHNREKGREGESGRRQQGKRRAFHVMSGCVAEDTVYESWGKTHSVKCYVNRLDS